MQDQERMINVEEVYQNPYLLDAHLYKKKEKKKTQTKIELEKQNFNPFEGQKKKKTNNNDDLQPKKKLFKKFDKHKKNDKEPLEFDGMVGKKLKFNSDYSNDKNWVGINKF